MFISRRTLCILAFALTASQTVVQGFLCPTDRKADTNPNYVDDANCKNYYNCPEKGQNHWGCPDGQVFDPNFRYCVVSKTCIKKYKVNCPLNQTASYGKYYADGDNCRKYFVCNSGKVVSHLDCADKMVFNPNTGFCAPEKDVPGICKWTNVAKCKA